MDENSYFPRTQIVDHSDTLTRRLDCLLTSFDHQHEVSTLMQRLIILVFLLAGALDAQTGSPQSNSTEGPSAPTNSSTAPTAFPSVDPAGTPVPGNDTHAPDTPGTSGSIDWYVIFAGVLIVFLTVGAGCYVTLMWQQRAVRKYKSKFELMLKEEAIQNTKLAQEFVAREEVRSLTAPMLAAREQSDSDDDAEADDNTKGAATAASRSLTAVMVSQPTLQELRRGPMYTRSSAPKETYDSIYKEMNRQVYTQSRAVDGASLLQVAERSREVHGNLLQLSAVPQLRSRVFQDNAL